MYTQEQPLIAAHAKSPEGFADVVTFAIATQNQHFYRVGTILADLHMRGLDACKSLNGTQKRGIAYVHQHAGQVLELLANTRCSRSPDILALRILIELPAIGIVKAGFIWQLIAGRVGCLDTHNLKTAGLRRGAFDYRPQSTEALTAHLSSYIAACAMLGTSEQLYNGWCSLIALKYPGHFNSAEDVSRKHAAWCGVQTNNQ